jgi:hypothetical protein
MKKNKFKKIWGLVGILLLGVGSWGFYSLFNQGASDLLSLFGITNFYIQTLIVITIVVLFFVLGGTSIWKAFEKLVKR